MAIFNSFLYVYQRVYGQSLMPQRTIAFNDVRWLKKHIQLGLPQLPHHIVNLFPWIDSTVIPYSLMYLPPKSMQVYPCLGQWIWALSVGQPRNPVVHHFMPKLQLSKLPQFQANKNPKKRILVLYEPWSILTIWLMVIPSIIRILIMVIINPYEPLDD